MTENDEARQVVDIVLASGSRWRLALLDQCGLSCRAVSPQVDEAAIVASTPRATAMARARAKAREVGLTNPQALVIGADQVLWEEGPGGGEAIGKPVDGEDHLMRLRRLRGQRHQLCTAVCLWAPPELGGVEEFDVITEVRMRADPSDEELLAYVGYGEASGCAGGYMVEGRGAWLLEGLDGDYFNVVGLPVFSLIQRLRARGFRLGADGRASLSLGGGEPRPHPRAPISP